MSPPSIEAVFWRPFLSAGRAADAAWAVLGERGWAPAPGAPLRELSWDARHGRLAPGSGTGAVAELGRLAEAWDGLELAGAAPGAFLRLLKTPEGLLAAVGLAAPRLARLESNAGEATDFARLLLALMEALKPVFCVFPARPPAEGASWDEALRAQLSSCALALVPDDAAAGPRRVVTLGGLRLLTTLPVKSSPGQTREELDAELAAARAAPRAAAAPVADAAGAVRVADEMLRSGRAQEALAACKVLLEEQPADAAALWLSGRCLLALGRPGEAIAPLERAVRGGASRAKALVDLGRAFDEAGRPGDALSALEDAVAASPAFALAWLERGRLARKTGNLPLAERCLTKTLELRPDFAEALMLRGVTRAGLGMSGESQADLARALERDPGLRPRIETALKERPKA